ncbi:hypothetical protein PAXRUDRAFT_822646 [Paxillus rubicundulus Ve08.2h10]|uniref:C2 NT-type domain-containing protein n=1 Tax=Paxillus rubicundulus Ve08.2h10 TaxID=930991 RepID=A0A0D0E4Z1_9AGAM|nr:hypothetical protein PAXRUDRAFT_822646 [Paxillus rubicundulus Ve08.2h10]
MLLPYDLGNKRSSDPVAPDSTSTSFSPSVSSRAASSTHVQKLNTTSDPVPSSPRHRSSTLKPPPARLNLVPHSPTHAHLQTPNPSLTSVASARDGKGHWNDRPPSPTPASPQRPHSPGPRAKSPTLLSPRPGTPSGHLYTPSFNSSHPTARPPSPTPNHAAHPQPSATPVTPTHPTGLRAHFAHLLPRHAVFLVRLTVHQLHNVPLVHGEFAVRWKVKGVTSPPGGGILGKVKGKSKAKSKVHNGHGASLTPVDGGKGTEKERGGETAMTRESDTDSASLLDGASASISDTHSIANSSSTHSYSYDYAHSTTGSVQGHATMRSQPLIIPSVVISANSPRTSPSAPPLTARSVSGTSSITSVSTSSASSASYYANGKNYNPPAHYLSADWLPQGPNQSPTSTHFDTQTQSSHPHTHDHGHTNMKYQAPNLSQTPPKAGYSPAKGITRFLQLKDHNVIWEQTLDFAVQISVGREKSELGDCLAKFVIMQRVVPGDPDAPRNPRVGAVYLNLAQYVDAGVVTRRYLLRESKTNATLKLTIHLEHTAGELSYVAPPLPKGEILSGVTSLLESSDIYRTRPCTWDLYKDAAPHSSSEEDACASGSDASSAPVSGEAILDGDHDTGFGCVHGQRKNRKKRRQPFDPAMLPTINDPRGTERLIEALFNPVPVTQHGKVNPFTYLVEVDGEGGDDLGVAEHKGNRHGLEGDREDDGNELLYADTLERADEPHEVDTDGGGSDYHSIRSQLSGDGSLRSKRFFQSIGRLKVDNGVEDVAVSTGIGVNAAGGGIEKRAWWQKVLRPPAGA